jgi:uncharacterized membrane protein
MIRLPFYFSNPIKIYLVILIVALFMNVGDRNQSTFAHSSYGDKLTPSSTNLELTDQTDLLIQKLTYHIQLTTTGVAGTHIEFFIQNLKPSALTFIELWLNSSFSSFFVYDAFGSLSFTSVPYDNSNLLNITLRDPLLVNQSFVFFVQCQWTITILDNHDPLYYYAEFPVILPFETEWLLFEISFPTEYELIDDPYNIAPSYGATIQESGEQTYVSWFLTSSTINYGSPIVFSIKYTSIPLTVSDEDKFSLFSFILGSLITLILGIIGLFGYSRINKRISASLQPTRVNEFAQMLLNKDELHLLSLIETNNGNMLQSDLEEHSNFSRSKVSRLVGILTEKGLVTRTRFGRTNRIYLTKEAREYLTSSMSEEL